MAKFSKEQLEDFKKWLKIGPQFTLSIDEQISLVEDSLILHAHRKDLKDVLKGMDNTLKEVHFHGMIPLVTVTATTFALWRYILANALEEPRKDLSYLWNGEWRRKQTEVTFTMTDFDFQKWTKKDDERSS